MKATRIQTTNRGAEDGFTLIELVVAVMIAAILAAIAIPAYSNYVVRGNRAVARSQLTSLAAAQEIQSLQRQGYVTSFSALNGVSGTSFCIDRNAAVVACTSGSSIYNISFAASPAASSTAYALQATAVNSQTRDKDCSVITLQSTGMQQATNSSGASNLTCWTR